jgi:hypothetical protein
MRLSHRLATTLGINQTLSWGMTFYLPAIIAAPAAKSLQINEMSALGAFSWALLVTGVCAPRVGRWIDRHGGRGAIALSIVIMAIGLILLSVSTSLILWYISWSIIGIGMALGLYDAAFAATGTLLGRDAGPAIAGITIIAGFASSVFWSVGTALMAPLGWRGLLLLYAALMLGINLPLVLAFIPSGGGHGGAAGKEAPRTRTHGHRLTLVCVATFFTLRWFITSAIAVHVLELFRGSGLSGPASVTVAALIGPGQVLGRIMEWVVRGRLGLLARARIGALLFPLGAIALLRGGPIAAGAFALLYGMSNGIMTINRGTLPLALFGPSGYATLLGWLALPVLFAQATAPTLTAPLVAALPPLQVLMLAGGLAMAASLLLLPLRIPAEANRQA